jgi:hypothetical protein
LADLPAYVVFLLVQRVVFSPGNMAAVLACHIALLLPDLMVIKMQSRCFGVRHVAFPYFLVNAMVLIREAMVDLSAAWVRRVPVSLC